jgi:hypothetical protein
MNKDTAHSHIQIATRTLKEVLTPASVPEAISSLLRTRTVAAMERALACKTKVNKDMARSYLLKMRL